MSSKLREMNIDFSFIEAIDGSKLDNSSIDFMSFKDEILLSNAEIGCMLSHISCWKYAEQNFHQKILILEDDLHFVRDFKEIVESIDIPVGLSVVKLESFNATVTIEVPSVQTIKNRHINKLVTPQGGTGAYLINRETALYLLENAHRMRHAIDIEMFFPKRGGFKELNIFQINPAICVQDMIIEGPQFGRNSYISENRSDVRILKLRSRKNLIMNKIKEPFRPIYRLIYSYYLSRFGMKRVKIIYK